MLFFLHFTDSPIMRNKETTFSFERKKERSPSLFGRFDEIQQGVWLTDSTWTMLHPLDQSEKLDCYCAVNPVDIHTNVTLLTPAAQGLGRKPPCTHSHSGFCDCWDWARAPWRVISLALFLQRSPQRRWNSLDAQQGCREGGTVVGSLCKNIN